MIERKGIVEFSGRGVTVVGADMEVGQTAPDFRVTSLVWEEFHALERTKGKLRVILSVLSLETSVCDTETRRFNEEADALGDDVVVIVVSADLPFTQARWCGAAGIDRVMVVSDHAHTEFGINYGCLLKEPRILRRAAFIVDKDGIVQYAAYMPELGQEPDYAEVLSRVRALLGKSG
jgi:thiol peroxidase